MQERPAFRRVIYLSILNSRTSGVRCTKASLDPTDREDANKFEDVRDFINKPLGIEDVEHAAKLLEDARG